MFPLSTVLFPHGVLPLHIFEPRYRVMMEHCLAGDRCFGVVLISRGSEVGGGETRSEVGTVAVIDRLSTLPDGRSLLLGRGTRRFRVVEWLADDPYPAALVEWLGEDDTWTSEGSEALLDRATTAVRRARALLSELRDVPAAQAPDPAAGPDEQTWLLCDQAPITPFDRQRLLECPEPRARLRLLVELAEAAADDLAALLAGG